MALSNDLISKFVKVTNDTSKDKKESTVYGTAVEYNGKMYARLDGSDLLTPISSTADTKAGDRVTVMIKDHIATVTGNISSPSASKGTVTQLTNTVSEVQTLLANKVDVEQLNAEKGRIDDLVTENTVVKNQLTATNAEIVTLKTENATITEKLTANEADIVKLEADIASIDDLTTKEFEAVNADIHNLEATYATFNQTIVQDLTALNGVIDNLDSKYATIQNLDVEKGRIDVLETTALTSASAVIKTLQSDVADIDTLIFGSASGNVIQSSFSNAVVAQLGNAAIKSAMIESVAADKITSGDIITNNVRVLSEDGKLLISDETIQISDENRVRVQIGKDASNDYSINIWDENGNLMFSEGGITDSAIKEAIIRDDMVSDNANISAKKLDIGSLFSTMNEDGSHTLHSSKIFMDSDGQTLNVSFANLTSKVGTVESTATDAKNQAAANGSNIVNITNKVTSQGTDILAIQGQISNKIWQQDITNSIQALQIGSRNILLDSEPGYIFTGSDQPTVSSSDTTVPKITTLTTGTGNRYVWVQNKYAIPTTQVVGEIGLEYSFSVDVKVTGSFTGARMWIDIRAGSTKALEISANIPNDITKNTWIRVSGTAATVKSGTEYTSSLICLTWSSSTVGSTIEYRNVKLEKGNKATDWTPAPEDIPTGAELNALSTKYSEVKQTLDGLTSTVAGHTTEISKKADGTTVATVNDKVTSLQQNLEGFKTTVSNTYSTKENLSDAIDDLSIGGRNYIILSRLGSHTPYNTTPTCNGNVISTSFLTTSTASYLTLSITGFTPSKDTYTLSGYIKVNGSIPTSNYFTSDRVSTYGTYISPMIYDPTTGYFSCTQNYPGNSAWIIHALTRRASGSADVVTLEKLKFEKGSKATDWTPSPEDVDADISALEGRVSRTETSITQTSDSITSLASRTTAVEGVAANAYSGARRKSGTIDLTDTSKYNVNTYYPVVCDNQIPTSGYYLHEAIVQLNSGSKPSWSTHTNGFSCNLSCRMKAHGWGTVDSATLGWIDDFSYAWCDKMPAYIQQNTNASRAIFYLRGGGKYFIYTNYDCTWTVHTTDVTLSSSTFSPTTTPENHANLVNNWETVSRIGTAETKIIQTADSITSLADKTVVLENKFSQYPTTAQMNSAITQKADSINSTVAATYTTKIDSAYEKLGNLVKNGYGEYMDATGWSSTTFTRGDCPEGCHGYFCSGTSIDKIPYDPTKVYDYEYYVRLHSGRSGSNYFSIYPLDVDGNLISANHVPMAITNLAYLSKELKNGDTVVYFKDLSNWNVGVTQTYQRSFLIFGYKDSTGYTYPDGTYSRNTHMEIYANNSDVNLTNNTITLKSAWTGGTIAANTCIGQCSHGSTYVYYGQAGAITNTNWIFKSGEITANPEGDNNQRRMAYATAFKVYLYNNVADYAGICIREQTEDSKARTAADEAKGIADEANVTATAAKSSIEQLSDQISMLVVDGNNASMMTQTADGGWQFNMGTVNASLDKLDSDVSSVKEQSDTTDANVSDLTKRVNDIETITEYVNIGTYKEPDTGQTVPSIDLGEADSNFKLKITNKEILFTDGTTDPPVHIDSEDRILQIETAEIKSYLRIGNVVLSKRPNGNVGISWKEG